MIRKQTLQIVALVCTCLTFSAGRADPFQPNYYCPSGFTGSSIVRAGSYFEGCFAVMMFNVYDCTWGSSSFSHTFSVRTRKPICV
jgi:hypothetical protein